MTCDNGLWENNRGTGKKKQVIIPRKEFIASLLVIRRERFSLRGGALRHGREMTRRTIRKLCVMAFCYCLGSPVLILCVRNIVISGISVTKWVSVDDLNFAKTPKRKYFHYLLFVLSVTIFQFVSPCGGRLAMLFWICALWLWRNVQEMRWVFTENEAGTATQDVL